MLRCQPVPVQKYPSLLRIFGFVRFTVSLNGVVGILQMNVKNRALEVKRMCDDYTYLVWGRSLCARFFVRHECFWIIFEASHWIPVKELLGFGGTILDIMRFYHVERSILFVPDMWHLHCWSVHLAKGWIPRIHIHFETFITCLCVVMQGFQWPIQLHRGMAA
jgi:hypothetical protein